MSTLRPLVTIVSFLSTAAVLGACGGSQKEADDPGDEKVVPVVDHSWDPSEEDKEAASGNSSHDQASLGATLFGIQCGGCHGAHGAGGDGGPLVIGPGGIPKNAPDGAKLRTGTFLYPVDIFNFIKKEMPPKKKGSLEDEEAWALTAYILVNNGTKLEAPISADNANDVTIVRNEASTDEADDEDE